MKRKIAQKHLSEVQIDALARQTAVNAGSSKTVADSHIVACISCRTEYEMLLGLYQATARELSATHDRSIRRLAAPPLLSGFVELQPFHLESDLFPHGEEMLLLAAQGTEAKISRYHHVGTFASQQAHVLVRLVRDADRKEVNVHLLTPIPEDAAHVLLAVTVPGKDTFMIATGKDAKATIPDPGEIEWNNVSVLVSPLIASYPAPLREGKLYGKTNDGPFLNVVSSPAGWQIEVRGIRGSNGGHLVAIAEDGSASVFEARESPLLLTFAFAEHLRELRLFH